ncbi:ABC transporter ATP-binding protein [Calidifontibacillus erzurumensis]|uniref:ABC transporter ATP-binding protein n=1 Tax=Calidifontibacillus erzurumensis TaxID=2741433 RepID=UPI0035B52D93
MVVNAIEFHEVSKTFPKASKPSVYNTTLTIEEGTFVTILGTSGSGKTTLLKMVNRIHEPSSGKIFVQGEDVSKVSVTELRRKIGYVIQQIGLFPHMTIEENIATVPKILKWDSKKIKERVEFLLELVHLPPNEFLKRYPRQLSGGQQQRVGIARAMASDPDIMLMDEPFGAIDAITRSSLQDELISIQKRLKKTILFVTHDINEALKLGDKIIVMDQGKVQQYDTPLNILMNPANEFVSRLVSSEDIFQLLGMLQADSVMVPLSQVSMNHTKTVKHNDHLKKVLTLLLNSDIDGVIVEDDKKNPIGAITFEQLKLNNKIKQAVFPL